MTDVEWQVWASTHRACWEVQPLIELHEGRKAQVGFEFNILVPLEGRLKALGLKAKAWSRVS